MRCRLNRFLVSHGRQKLPLEALADRFLLVHLSSGNSGELKHNSNVSVCKCCCILFLSSTLTITLIFYLTLSPLRFFLIISTSHILHSRSFASLHLSLLYNYLLIGIIFPHHFSFPLVPCLALILLLCLS